MLVRVWAQRNQCHVVILCHWDKPYLSRRFDAKKKNDNYAALFYKLKLCKIAPKCAVIMQTVRK